MSVTFHRTMRLFVNRDSTLLVRWWETEQGQVAKLQVAKPEHPDETWGPPTYLEEERTDGR